MAGRGCSPSPQDRPDALHVLVLTVAGWVNRPPEDQLAYLREEQRSLRASWPGGSVGPGACPWLAASARPVAACAATAGPARRVAWARVAAHRRAVSGDPRPLGPQRRAGAGGPDARLTRWCVARGGGAARCARRPCGPGDVLVVWKLARLGRFLYCVLPNSPDRVVTRRRGSACNTLSAIRALPALRRGKAAFWSAHATAPGHQQRHRCCSSWPG